MNENLGTKGTGKDRLRSIIISKKRKEKLKREYRERQIKEKEKILKRQQIQNLIKVVPIAVLGETVRVIATKTTSKEEQKPEIKKGNSKSQKLVIDDKVRMIIQSKVEVKRVIQNQIEIKKDILPKQEEKNKDNKENLQIKSKEEQITEKTRKEETNKKNHNIEKNKTKQNNKQSNKQDNKQSNKQDNKQSNKPDNVVSNILPITLAPLSIINIKNYQNQQKVNEKKEYIRKTTTGNSNDNELKKLETFKIIESYEKRFKDIRYELKGLIYEYNVIREEISKTSKEEDVNKLIERLNLIISKLEELKSKIKIDDLDKYDDNYLYSLVEEYIKNFDDKQIIGEIKDSDLYILLSSKISELDSEKDKLSTNLTNKKEKLHISEEKLNKLKEQYFNIEKFNKILEEFQKQQEETIINIQEKIKTSDKITEQIEAKIVGITNESQRLLDLLTIQMMIPGLNNAKVMATTTMLYLLFMKKAMKPKIEIEKHKVIKVTDYSKEIENNIKSINDISDMLSKTSYKLDDMIMKFKIEYKDFLGEIPECNQLLSNLQKVKSNLTEKEYEIEKIKQAQKQNLERNYNKIKTLNNKKVM